MAISFTPQPLNKFMLEDPNFLLAKKLQTEQSSGPAPGGIPEVLARLLRGHQIGQERRAGTRTFDKMRENQANTLGQIKSLFQPPEPQTLGEIRAIQENDIDFGQPQQFNALVAPQAVRKPSAEKIASILMGSENPTMRSQGLELALKNMALKEDRKSKLDVARAKITSDLGGKIFLGDLRDQRRADIAFQRASDTFNVDRQKAINAKQSEMGEGPWNNLGLDQQEKSLGMYQIGNAPKRSDYFQMPGQTQTQTQTPRFSQDQLNLLNRQMSPPVTSQQLPVTSQQPTVISQQPTVVDQTTQEPPIGEEKDVQPELGKPLELPQVSNFSSGLKTLKENPNSNQAKTLTSKFYTPTDNSGIVDETQIGQLAHKDSTNRVRRLLDLIPKDIQGRPKYTLYSELGQKFVKTNPAAIKIMEEAKAIGRNAPKALLQIKSKQEIISSMNVLAQPLKDMSEFRGQAVRAGQTLGENVLGAFKQAAPSLAKILGDTDTQYYQQSVSKLGTQAPILLNFIRKATEQGARSLDSNKELDFYVQAVGNAQRDPYVALFALSQLDAYYGAESLGQENTIKKAIGDNLYNRVRNQSSVTLKKVKTQRDQKQLLEELRLDIYEGSDRERAKNLLRRLSGKIDEYSAYEQNFDPNATVPR
jgi:hypothetical protein